MKVYYLGLEPYQERYTEQLTGWVTRRLTQRGIEHEVITGDRLHDGIRTGVVLDAHGRTYWALTQTANLVRALADEPADQDDWLWIDDLFHPGLEALPYIFDQLGQRHRPRIAVRNWAQSVDPDDFTFPMRRWMRPYEQMADRVVDVTFVASTVQKEMLEAACLDTSRIAVVHGLPFDADTVREQGPVALTPWAERPYQVVYSSRFDKEKQPHFFMDIVERMAGGDTTFHVCTGAAELRSNDPTALLRAQRLVAAGKLEVHYGLDKRAYYRVLANSRVQLNTARQDFVSFTACEASTFDVPTLAPAFRAFPETLENRASQLYVPWSVSDACTRLAMLLLSGEPDAGRVALQNHGTLDRMIDVLTG